VSAPRFSVVVPTHQAAAFIGDTLGGVLAQTFQDFEVVVVDNGSTDGTDEIVDGLGDDRIHYRWQEDSGLPANSRNVGISMATGEYVAFLDADDSWTLEKLERVEAALQADPGLDVICHDVEIVAPDGSVTGMRAYALEDGDPYAQLLYRGNFLTTSATTVRRSVLERHGGFSERSEWVTTEDYDLWLRIARDGGHFAMLAETLGRYLVHPGGASANLVRHYDNTLAMLDTHYLALAAEGRLDEKAALWRRTRSRAAEARDLTRKGDAAGAAKVLAALPGERMAAIARYRDVAP
jgi:glycosyltransferase involved in cell wall biosynthesis